MLTNPDGHHISLIPCMEHGLYCVLKPMLYHPLIACDIDETAAMVEKVTSGELHCHMGHIAPNTAKNLIQKGLVTGLELKDSPTPFTHCSSCIYAKAQRKSVPIVHEGVCATGYGAEVHTDVWGPSKIATLAG